jgi:hypothetical protein
MATKSPAGAVADPANPTPPPIDPVQTDLVPPAAPATVKARVLSDCTYGSCGDVVEVDAAVASSCLLLDADPAAVAYALTLPQNQPAADAA